MPTTIEQLELEVQSSSTSAVAGIDALSASLSKLKNAVRGGVGLTSVANQVRNLDTALKSMDSSGADKIDKLASSLEKLKGLGSLKISSSIGNQLQNIGSAAASLTGVDFSAMEKLGTALRPLNNLNASGLKSTINALNKLPKLADTLDNMDMTKFTGQIQQLSTALAPLTNQLNAVTAAFNRLPTNIRRAITVTNRISQENNKAANSYMNLYAKIKMAMGVVRTGARVIASWITQSNQYIEDLNLFTASMGKYAEEAQNYAEAVSEALGIDPGEFMRNQGVFNTIISGFGVASDKAYLMSKNLTQLGYDISSFFNISFEDAMQKLQSGIAGELEPLRRLGYDLSVARLQEEALALGIEKKVSAMTQAEKSQLRYYAIMTQVTTAQGDMARTLNAPANQLRVLQAQVTQFARALGNIFIPALNAILPYAIALAKVIRLVANSIANFFGFKLPKVDYSSITAGANAMGDLANNADGTADGLKDATSKAKKLKNALLGIDELNVLSKDDSSIGSGSGSGSGTGIGGGDLGIDLPTYDFLGDAITSKVDEIIQKMKEWLGLTDEINSWGDFFHTRLGRILTTVGAIGLGFAAWKIGKGVLSALQYINGLKGLGLGSPLKIGVGVSLLVTGIALEWSGIVDAIMYELNSMNFGQIVSGGLLTVGGGAFLGSGIASWITTAFANSAVATALATAAENLGLGSVSAAGAALGAGVAAIIAGLPMYFVGIWDAIKNGLNWLNGILIPLGSTMAAAGIGTIIGAAIGSVGGPLGAGIGALIGLAVGLITDGIIAIVQHWDDITSFLENFFTKTVPGIWNSFVAWLKNLPQTISKWFTDLWQPIKDFDWNQFGHDIGYKVGTVVKNICNAFRTFFTQTLPETWETVKKSFKTFFTETLPNFFTQTIPELWETIKSAFITFFTVTLPEALGNIGQWFKDVGQSIWDGIKEGWDTAVKAVKDFITGFVDGFKEALGIHSPSTVMRDEVGMFCGEGILEGLLYPFKKIGKWVKTNIIKPISKAIKNNPITDIVVDIKNNASELWEKAKGWWKNETKDGLSLETAVKLLKDGWSTVKNWIGNIPIVKQGIGLLKSGWTTVKNWIGNIPRVSQMVGLVKSGWNTVKEWVGNIPTLSQGISLLKSGWTTVKKWIGNIPTLSQGISLFRRGWSKVSSWVRSFGSGVISQGVSLARNCWSTVASWVRTQIGGAVDVTVNLISKWKGKIKEFFGLSGGGVVSAGGSIKMFASGGIITPNMWKAMPKYAGGTNRAHGSMFVAGESGAELVGHVNGTTEVLNRFQLASVMHSSIVSGMAQFSGYWQSMSRDIVTCANGIINAVVVSTAGINENLVLASASGYDPYNSLAQTVYEDSKKSYDGAYSDDSWSRNMREFYHEYVEPTLKEIATDTKRQADKKEQTIVKVGNRTINDAVTTQKEANGFNFTE